MSLAIAYWIIMLIGLILGLVFNWPFTVNNVKGFIPSFIVWLLLVLLGWKVFGPPLHS